MIGFLRFFRKKNERNTIVTEVYGHRPDGRAYAPHCDASVLHAPGVCVYCDHYPEWQEYRQTSRINFTGQSDPHYAPCPSEFFRTAEIRDRWPGNRAWGADA